MGEGGGARRCCCVRLTYLARLVHFSINYTLGSSPPRPSDKCRAQKWRLGAQDEFPSPSPLSESGVAAESPNPQYVADTHAYGRKAKGLVHA